jgi:hypothetical protein
MIQIVRNRCSREAVGSCGPDVFSEDRCRAAHHDAAASHNACAIVAVLLRQTALAAAEPS